MALRLLTQRDGTLRQNWYGVYKENGKRSVVNLNIEWKGAPPASGLVSDAGDEVFERSRERAAAELARYVSEARRKERAETLTERLIESKTGQKLRYVRIDQLASGWRRIRRKTKPTEAHLAICDSHFGQFVHFMKEHAPGKTYLYEVTGPDPAADTDTDESDAGRFVEKLRDRLSPATAQYKVRLLNNAFRRMLPAGAKSPFADFVGQRGTTATGVVNRKPFTPDELRRLLDAARQDAFMYPLIVCAAMTGMRRGDVCRLRWEGVNLTEGWLSVKSSKTGSTVDIPIFPLLREVLIDAGEKNTGYVWPEAAKLLSEHRNALSVRFKRIVAVALGGYTPDNTPEPEPLADILERVIDAIRENIPEGPRLDRMVDVMKRYARGQGVRQIQREMGVSRATISTDLNTAEAWSGARFNRRGAGRHSKQSVEVSIAALTRKQRAQGLNAASIYDFHALRTTWVTIALTNGVDMELVRLVTGHQTVKVVLEHYYKPRREELRAALQNALPDVLTGNGKDKSRKKKTTAADDLAALVAKVQDGTATEADKKRLRLLAAKV